MQAKKQTIWLVSMLSLMVVLSAYYLFTDDVKTSGSSKNQKWDQMVLDDISSPAPASKSTKEKAVETATNDYFANAQMERDAKQEAEFDRLMQTMNNANEATAASTMKTLGDLQDQAEKVSAIEEQLTDEYSNAVLTQNEGKWDVTVQADVLQKTQAVSITELVMHELGLKPEQIMIHAIKQ